MHINNTRSSTAEDCLRRYFWSHEFHGFGIEGQGLQENLAFGSLMHYALAHLYSGASPWDAFRKAMEEWKEEYHFDNLQFDTKNAWEENFSWARRILSAYDSYRLATDDFEPIQIEVEGSVQLGEICYRCGHPYMHDEATHCGVCDAQIHSYVFRCDLAAVKNGGIYIIDHKTTSSTGDNYLSSFHYSMQLYGYAYAYGKALGADVSGTCANIIRKLKSIGIEDNAFKQCPECRGGVKKRVGCPLCGGEGRVEREKKPEDSAFIREWEGWDDDKAALFLRTRLRTVENILTERERFKTEPDAAWPMNPNHCFWKGRCPFVKLCWEGDPDRWYDPIDELLLAYQDKTADYVSVKALVKEEGR